MTVDGQPHPHGFRASGCGVPTARVVVARGMDGIDAPRVESGVNDLCLLKTTGSEFKGFLKDDLTTLPETADVGGATVYTVSDKASDAYAATVAAKENAADATVGVDGQADTADVNDILFDLTRPETRAYSHVFARTLVNYWKVAGRLNKNPQRAAGFVVLKAPDVPSVLLELGYLSNATDAASLTAADWRDKATARMSEAVVAYFADRQGPAKARAGVPMPLKQANAEPAR